MLAGHFADGTCSCIGPTQLAHLLQKHDLSLTDAIGDPRSLLSEDADGLDYLLHGTVSSANGIIINGHLMDTETGSIVSSGNVRIESTASLKAGAMELAHSLLSSAPWVTSDVTLSQRLLQKLRGQQIEADIDWLLKRADELSSTLLNDLSFADSTLNHHQIKALEEAESLLKASKGMLQNGQQDLPVAYCETLIPQIDERLAEIDLFIRVGHRVKMPMGPRNIALAKRGGQAIADEFSWVGSVYSTPEKAIDGNKETSWIDKDSRGQLTVRLDRSYTIEHMRIVFGLGKQKYLVEISKDGRNWDNVFGGWVESGSGPVKIVMKEPREASYVRVTIQNAPTPPNRSCISELEVYGR